MTDHTWCPICHYLASQPIYCLSYLYLLSYWLWKDLENNDLKGQWRLLVMELLNRSHMTLYLCSIHCIIYVSILLPMSSIKQTPQDTVTNEQLFVCLFVTVSCGVCSVMVMVYSCLKQLYQYHYTITIHECDVHRDRQTDRNAVACIVCAQHHAVKTMAMRLTVSLLACCSVRHLSWHHAATCYITLRLTNGITASQRACPWCYAARQSEPGIC